MTAENNIHKKEGHIFNISDYLKQLRVKKGVSLEEAVNTLKISYDYLKAFEDGNFNSLPKDTYTRIFLRVYTEYLGGDVKEVMTGFEALSPGKKEVKTNQNTGKKYKIKFDSKNWAENVPINSNLILVCIIIILTVIIFVGLFCGRDEKKPLEETSFQEKEFLKTGTAESKPAAEVKKEVEPKNQESESLSPAEEKDKPKKLVLKAKAAEDVNLEMIVDDKITIKEVMKKDESRIWTAKNKFLINTDNIGALDWTFNDERFGILGPPGESKTGLSFPPEKKE
ncbi:MAG: RodZ domain-containing protein [bacterium]